MAATSTATKKPATPRKKPTPKPPTEKIKEGVTELADDIREDVVDKADDIVEMVEDVLESKFTIKTSHILVGVGVVAAGVAVAYIVKRRRKKEIHILPESVTIVGEDGKIHHVVEPEPLVLDEEVYEQIQEGRTFVEEVLRNPIAEEMIEEQAVVASTVFAADSDTWNYEEELAKRTPEEPYVIHKDEFFNQETDFEQKTITYYLGDNIMADEHDSPVYNWERTVGELKFGHGSDGDPHVFYVRNEKFRGEYEVILHEGHFAVEVEGLDATGLERKRGEIKHSRFRDD